MSATSVRDLPLWTRLVTGRHITLKQKALDELAATVTEEQIAELIEMSASESVLEADAAIRILMWVRPRDRISGAQRDRWAAGLLDIVRKQYPRNRLGILSHSALRDISREASTRFLASELDFDGLTEADLRSVITDLQVDGSPGALARLQQLAQHHDEAKKAWEQWVGLSRSALERLAKEWRETGRTELLDELWWKHIVRLREGTSVKELVDLLGEPTRRDGGRYWYEPADSRACLFLEADDQDRLVSYKLGG